MNIRNRENLRFKRIARHANVGAEFICDVGFKQCPNPYLKAKRIIGVDPNATEDDVNGNYSEVYCGVLSDYTKIKGREIFDAITAGEIIEHLEDPINFLRDCHSALKPNGKIILSTPNPNSLIEQFLTIFLSRKYFYTEEHVLLIPQRWLIRIMELAGFTDIKLVSGGFPVPVIGLIPFPRPWCYQTIAIGKKAMDKKEPTQ